MRTSLLAGVAVVGVSVAFCGTAFAQAPTTFPMVTQAGKLDGAAPGSVTVSIGATLFTGLEFQGGTNTPAHTGSTSPSSPQQLTYMRLYPNMDYAAPNGIHYGVSAEIRSNSANQGNGSQGAAGASGATMVWYSGSVYVSSDKFGKLSIGATPADAIGTLAVGTGDDFGTGGFYGEYGIKNGPGFAMADTYFGDIPKQDILYVSPSFAGFTVAADWQPNSVGMNNSSGQTDGTDGGGQSRNRIEVAGKYAGAFGSTSLKVSAGYAHATANPVLGGPQTYNDVNLYTAGAVVGFAGFSVEGSIVGGKWNYASIDSGSDQGPPPKGGKSSTAFIVGPGYTIGPFAIGAQYYHVDFDASENGGLLGTTARVNGEALGASYVVGPGVTLEFDALASKVKTPQVGGGRTDLNGWGVALGTYFKW